jgi:hypothetical protein
MERVLAYSPFVKYIRYVINNVKSTDIAYKISKRAVRLLLVALDNRMTVLLRRAKTFSTRRKSILTSGHDVLLATRICDERKIKIFNSGMLNPKLRIKKKRKRIVISDDDEGVDDYKEEDDDEGIDDYKEEGDDEGIDDYKEEDEMDEKHGGGGCDISGRRILRNPKRDNLPPKRKNTGTGKRRVRKGDGAPKKRKKKTGIEKTGKNKTKKRRKRK